MDGAIAHLGVPPALAVATAVAGLVALVAFLRARLAPPAAPVHERLAALDGMAASLQRLTETVGGLERIFSDKQLRGAFGEARMEAIVREALPRGAYRFQARLSTGARPDCLVTAGSGEPAFVIDAKFPLEGWRRLAAARAAGEERREREARSLFRRDVTRHVRAIAQAYCVPGETQGVALMFVPAEGVFATLHEAFPDLVERAHRARVMIVSPTLLVLALSLVAALSRDCRVSQTARHIRHEIDSLTAEIDGLAAAAAALSRHHGAMRDDLAGIATLAERLSGRSERLRRLDYDPGTAPTPLVKPAARRV